MDFTNDNSGAVIIYGAQNNLLPDYVKKSERITQVEADCLNKVAFADRQKRELPCHTKAASVLSALYCAALPDQYSEDSKDRILNFAEQHGCTEDVNRIFNHFDNLNEKMQEKKAAVQQEDDYALFLKAADGSTEGYYPIDSDVHVLTSMQHMEEDFKDGTLDAVMLRKLAKVLMNAARKMEIDDMVCKTVKNAATDRLPDPVSAAETIESRGELTDDMEGYRSVIRKMASDIVNSKGDVEAILEAGEKAASAIQQLDNANSIYTYSQHYPNPVQIVFSGPSLDTMAKYAADTVRIMGVAVPVDDICNFSDELINDYFTKASAAKLKEAKDIVSGIRSMDKSSRAASVIETVDENAQKMFLRMLAGLGW